VARRRAAALAGLALAGCTADPAAVPADGGPPEAQVSTPAPVASCAAQPAVQPTRGAGVVAVAQALLISTAVGLGARSSRVEDPDRNRLHDRSRC